MPAGTVTLAVMFTGALEVGLTVVPGERSHEAPLMSVVQETVTLWLNDPEAVTWKFTGEEVAPRATVTLEGDGVVSQKLIRCRVTGSVCAR